MGCGWVGHGLWAMADLEILIFLNSGGLAIWQDISSTKWVLNGLWVGRGQWATLEICFVHSLSRICPVQNLSSCCPPGKAKCCFLSQTFVQAMSLKEWSLSGLWVGRGRWAFNPLVLSLTWICPIQSLSSFCPLSGWLGCKGENKSFQFLSRDCPLIFWWWLGNSEDKCRTKVWLEHFHKDKSWIWWGH